MKKIYAMLGASLLLTACSQLPTTQNKSAKPVAQAQEKIMKQITVTSKYDFATTVERLSKNIEGKGMTIFAKIDHQDAGKKAGLTMQPATVIVFGNPKAGTPLMKQEPTFALQLPLKVLVTQVDNNVLVSFNNTKAMIADTNIEFSQVENTLAGAEKLIVKTVTE